jgi:hypothetical protein
VHAVSKLFIGQHARLYYPWSKIIAELVTCIVVAISTIPLRQLALLYVVLRIRREHVALSYPLLSIFWPRKARRDKCCLPALPLDTSDVRSYQNAELFSHSKEVHREADNSINLNGCFCLQKTSMHFDNHTLNKLGHKRWEDIEL